MSKQPKILAFAGSLREKSYNKRVLKVAIRGAENAGVKVTYIRHLSKINS
ncbi:MAG TPA: NAD(P)H-dependent oxidoreductase [Pyrinomonadaceae bacterium]|nr:NAD(P)H-dependent oxidoreductase [Pyrinomonadaceae bacterium]